MTAAVAQQPLAALPPISLDELTTRAALLTRMDRKYLLPTSEVSDLLAALGQTAIVLEIAGARSFAYESVYFDTPELTSYLLAAHRRRRRFKIRTRTYLDSSLCWLEVKIRGARGSTVKHRLPHELCQRTALADGRQFVDSVLIDESISCGREATLTPTLITTYQRSTLYLPDTESRVTIDTDLGWDRAGQPRMLLPGLAIVETKTDSTASGVDRLLWANGRRPIRISKYATGLAAMQPGLPSAPWHRILRRHFTPTGGAAPR